MHFNENGSSLDSTDFDFERIKNQIIDSLRKLEPLDILVEDSE